MLDFITATDFYKTDHRRQLPVGTQRIYENWTARSTRIGGADSVITAKNLGITEFLNMNADLTWSLVSNGYTLKSGNYRVDTPVAFTDAAGTPVYLLDFVISGKDSDVDHWLSADNDTLRTAYTIMNPTFNVDTYVRLTSPVTQEY